MRELPGNSCVYRPEWRWLFGGRWGCGGHGGGGRGHLLLSRDEGGDLSTQTEWKRTTALPACPYHPSFSPSQPFYLQIRHLCYGSWDTLLCHYMGKLSPDFLPKFPPVPSVSGGSDDLVWLLVWWEPPLLSGTKQGPSIANPLWLPAVTWHFCVTLQMTKQGHRQDLYNKQKPLKTLLSPRTQN